MNQNSSPHQAAAAFTRLELIVIVACLGFLALLILPAMAHNRTQNAGAGCLSNLRRLMVVWEMYRIDNNDYVMPNAPVGTSPGWLGDAGIENMTTAPANVTLSLYSSSLVYSLLKRDPAALRCPADTVPSSNGQRIRSYSMNGQVTGFNLPGVPSFNPSWRSYVKGSDLIRPSPASIFIFTDESPISINDGYLQLSLSTPSYPDLPAAYMDGGCGFSFADGHGEIHRWEGSTLGVPIPQGPVGPGPWGSTGLDFNWKWLREHSASTK